MCVCVCLLSGAVSLSLNPRWDLSEKSSFGKMEEKEVAACWAHRASRGLTSSVILPLCSGPVSDHPSQTAATGPAVFNGKDSPKTQQLVKNKLPAMPRPSALGSVPVLGVLPSLGPGVCGGMWGPSCWGLQASWNCCCLGEESGQVSGRLLSPWGCARALGLGDTSVPRSGVSLSWGRRPVSLWAVYWEGSRGLEK